MPADSERLTANTSLLFRATERDVEAWRLLTRIYGPLVYSWARKAGLQDSDAANIVQDVFLTVHAKLDPERKGRFRSWIWQIFRSRLVDHFRQMQAARGATGGSAMIGMIHQIADQPADESSEDGRREMSELREQALAA